MAILNNESGMYAGNIVQDAAGIIASGINRALQPALSDAEIAAMMD